jgi:regulation of enolase protein 1 (concanavalin A-like superfamily)
MSSISGRSRFTRIIGVGAALAAASVLAGCDPASGIDVSRAALVDLSHAWSHLDVTDTAQVGGDWFLRSNASSLSGTDGTYEVRGSGAGIGGASDGFFYVYQALPTNAAFTACVRVSTIAGPTTTRVGIMMRDGALASDNHVATMLSPSMGDQLPLSTRGGQVSSQTAFDHQGLDVCLRLVRTGSSFTAWYKRSGGQWTTFGAATLAMGSDPTVGLAVTSGDAAVLAKGFFDSVSLVSLDGDRDLGNATMGSSSVAGADRGTYTVKGSGSDIAGTADGFHFKYQNVVGNVTITAHIASITGGDTANVKAGVMIRADDTNPGAANAFALVKPASYKMQARTAPGLGTTSWACVSGPTHPCPTNPTWVRLTRRGDIFTSYFSTDGTTWTQLDAPSFPAPSIAMGSATKVGLAVTGHGSSLATVVFDNVSITTPSEPVRNLRVAVEGGHVVLQWNDNCDDENGFRIERKVGTGAWTALPPVGPNTTDPANGTVPTVSYFDDPATTGSYAYRVFATSAAGESLPSEAATVTLLGASADTFVRQDGSYAGSNCNNAGTTVQCGAVAVKTFEVKRDASNSRIGFLKFTISSLGNTFQSAKVRLYGHAKASGDTRNVGIYAVSSTTWSETTATWNTKPTIDTIALSTVDVSYTSSYYELDVTDYLQQQKAAGATSVSFAVQGTLNDSDGPTAFNSRENASNQPQLAVTY